MVIRAFSSEFVNEKRVKKEKFFVLTGETLAKTRKKR